MPPRPRPRRAAAALLSGVVAKGLLAGCGGSTENPPEDVLVNAAGLSHPDLGLLLVGDSDFNDETGGIWQWTGRSWRSPGPGRT